MAIGTSNPVGSTDPRDLLANAENLDNLVNGASDEYPDRFSVLRKSWAYIESQLNPVISIFVPKTRKINGYDLTVDRDLHTDDISEDSSTVNQWFTEARVHAATHNATAKTTPVDADGVLIADSAASWAGKFLSMLNLYNYIISKLSSAGYIYLTTDTYANIVANYPAASYTGCKALCNNIGFYRTELISTGAHWIPVTGLAVHTKLTLSCYVAPSFTGTTNGAITFSTAFAAADAQCYVYYPANSIVSGQAAGLYYTVMSSTTAATVYNNTYTPAAGTFPTIPTSPTAFSGAVPGGGGSSGVEVTLFISPVIPGGLLSYYGSILSQYYCEAVANANSKTFRIKLASTNIASNTVGASPHFGGTHICSNHGSPSYQKSQGTLLNNVTTGVTLTGLVNTANDQSVTLTVQTNAAGDWAGWVNYQMTLGVNS